MSLFVVKHQHSAETCPAGDPKMGPMLAQYVSAPNVEQSGQVRDLEDQVNLRSDVVQAECTADRPHLPVQGDERGQPHAGHKLHLAQVQVQLVPPQKVHQVRELLADRLDGGRFVRSCFKCASSAARMAFPRPVSAGTRFFNSPGSLSRS